MKNSLLLACVISAVIFSLPVHSSEVNDLYPPDIRPMTSDTPLTVVKQVRPIYPVEAKFNNIEGAVTIKFVVTKEGEVTEPEVADAVPPGYFEEAAIETIRRYEFKPATRNGEPVDTNVTMQIKFSLNAQDAGYNDGAFTPASLLEIYMASFPDTLKKDYKEGKVLVKYIVTKEGNIKDPTVVESDPPGIFDEYALDAVRHYRYQPATRSGVPVDTVVQSPVEFSIN